MTQEERMAVIRLLSYGGDWEDQEALRSLKSYLAPPPLEQPKEHEWCMWNGGYKIAAIQAYRARVPDAGLKDTKDLFEAGPVTP